MAGDLLRVEDLKIDFHVHGGVIQAVKGVSFAIKPGSTVALVGESGSGKSVIAQAIMGILPKVGQVSGGRILFRRALAMAAEDIGLADPDALRLAVAARQAFDVLGPPEGYLPLAEMTIYLATAPKSNSSLRALHAALEAARETPALPVPMHIRNAPTGLMKELGYGAGYRYAHDSPDAYLPQTYLPDELMGHEFYRPGAAGYEKRIAERIAWWAERREAESRPADSPTRADVAKDAPGPAQGTQSAEHGS